MRLKLTSIVMHLAAQRAAAAAQGEDEGAYKQREVNERLKRTFPLALVRPHDTPAMHSYSSILHKRTCAAVQAVSLRRDMNLLLAPLEFLVIYLFMYFSRSRFRGIFLPRNLKGVEGIPCGAKNLAQKLICLFIRESIRLMTIIVMTTFLHMSSGILQS